MEGTVAADNRGRDEEGFTGTRRRQSTKERLLQYTSDQMQCERDGARGDQRNVCKSSLLLLIGLF